MELLDDGQAALTIRDYVCATCWGMLDKWPAEGRLWSVECRACRSSTRGYVTKAYALRRLAESQAEAAEVTQLLRGLGILPEAVKRTSEELLKEMGF